MICENVKKKLADYAVGGLDEQARTQIETHLASCADCRRELALLEATGAMLEPVEMVEPPAGMWDRLQERLGPRPVRVKPRARAWRRYLKPVLAGVAIAAILIAVVVGMPLVFQPAYTPAPAQDLPVYAGTDGGTYTETMLAAAWDQPLNDEASLALAMVMTDPDATGETVQ
jgi:anti-sigma factor RsiW